MPISDLSRRQFVTRVCATTGGASLASALLPVRPIGTAGAAISDAQPSMAGPKTADDVTAYICSHWDSAVRSGPTGDPNIVSVPIPHTVPSPMGTYKAMFYWDTYFHNLGLLRSGRLDLARSNCEALLWLLDRFGLVPNSVFAGDSNRSQPPYLTSMVREVFAVSQDRAWLEKCVPGLHREYRFWCEQRTWPNGLAHFGHNAERAYLLKFYADALAGRLGANRDVPESVQLEVSAHLLAEAEAGKDFTPLYSQHAQHYADIELNTLLWCCERDFADFARALGKPADEAASWRTRADTRARLIRQHLWDEKAGLFRCTDMVWNRFGTVAHLGTFQPLWAGLATPAEAARVRDNLHRFERDFGVAFTEPYAGSGMQWGYPASWPPLSWIAAASLERYGYREDARRLARKYVNAQVRVFEKNGHLWEKLSAVSGEPDEAEYSADPMLGWTAGVFLAMRELLATSTP
jgi:alpha,alpha-trehalase